MVTVDVAALQLQAIDGPLPDALMGQGQYAAGQQQFMHMPAGGANGMMMSPGQAVPPQQHMGQGIPGVCTLRLSSHCRAILVHAVPSLLFLAQHMKFRSTNA